jgi:2-amino-4-hydroxy-6-hydroxymethyldihydropteridine diphosphokinase
VISLGSNVGERESHILSAAAKIASAGGIFTARLSSLYETDPVGEGYSRPFVNAVMIVRTRLSPRLLLKLGQSLEREAGRDRDGRNADRTLDVDLILCGGSVVDETDLTVPHPRFMDRLFVLVPLAEIEPGFPLPGGGAAAEAAEACSGTGRVARISSRGRIGRKSL